MTAPPMPVIVGVARSGTTLLRLMLDAHSRRARFLAIARPLLEDLAYDT